MAEGRRVFSDARKGSPSGCKKLGKHGSRKRAVRRGQVVSITGDYKGLTTEYVKDIGYDEYAQRVFIEYGNGVKTEYSYNKERRWLANIRTQRRSETYQNIEYSFDKVGNVLGYKNDTTYYSTEQNYTYDNLYQLTEAQGKSINKPYGPIDYISNYKQTFSFDTLGMGNMTSKVSSVYNNPDRLLGENINYSLEYEYDENYAHRVKRIGNRYYSYDENGNVVLEQDEPITTQDEQRYEIQELGENLYGVEYGWALENEEEQNKVGSSGIYKRRYRWNERNLMQESSENRQSVYYRYGADGQRALKSSNQSETLYFNTMWSWLHNSSAYNTERESKHIYLGSERLVTRTNGAGSQGNTYTAQVSTYYYHSDHLGSAQLITDNEGREYERIEYTPYGEYWIEKRAPENKTLPFKFTGKERDEETGLYYYGARYLDPKTSRWLSADPALSDYIPMAPVNDEAKKHNQNLPGMGGIYNTVNFHLYHYAGNNPVKYTDPDGRDIILLNRSYGGGGFGHNAVMIGNDTDGWILYSKDDINKNTRKEYATFAAFLEDNHNADYKDKYDRYASLQTSRDDDKTMQEEGDKIYNRKYALVEKTNKDGTIEQNCADLVADIVSKVKKNLISKPKIEPGDKSRKGPYTWHFLKFDIFFRKGEIESPIDIPITNPNLQYEWFIYDNQIIGSNNIPY